MNIMAVDDECFALQVLTDAIKEAVPSAEVYSFKSPKDALAFGARMPDAGNLSVIERKIKYRELPLPLNPVSAAASAAAKTQGVA